MVKDSDTSQPIALACTQCRKKHLRCDAALPTCTRCLKHHLDCTYVPSNRGKNRGSKRLRLDSGSPGPQRNSTGLESPQSSTMNLSSNSNTIYVPPSSSANRSPACETQGLEILAERAASRDPIATAPIEHEQYIKSYYTWFHPHHPILVPVAIYHSQNYPACLQLAVSEIGKHFLLPRVPVSTIVTLASRVIQTSTSSIKQAIHHVQTLTLYAIVMHTLLRPIEARKSLSHAITISNSIGLHRRDFASSDSDDPITRESLRRTWWELYTVDAYFAALHRQLNNLGSLDHPEDVPFLPTAYKDPGDTPVSLDDLDARFFLSNPDNQNFSDDCYRVDAARILCRATRLALNEDIHDDEEMTLVDGAIAAWCFNVPKSKPLELHRDKSRNSALVQAHILLQCASILLHFPRTGLPFAGISTTETACFSDSSALPIGHSHISKVETASKVICALAIDFRIAENCSPLLVCAMVLATMVEVSLLLDSTSSAGKSAHKDRTIFLLGILGHLGKTWTTAEHAANRFRAAITNSLRSEQTLSRGLAPATGEGVVPLPFISDPIQANDQLSDMSWLDIFSWSEMLESN